MNVRFREKQTFAKHSEFLHKQPRPALGRAALVFGFVYLGAMVLRYVIRMAILPEERWVGGSIPIFMHWGLAWFVILFARYRRRIERRPASIRT